LPAFDSQDRLGVFNLSSSEEGSALAEFGDALDEVGEAGIVADVVLRQGMIGMTIDNYREKYGVDCPNYLKIDVDSIEDKILAGAEKTLKDKELKSVLVELDENDAEYVERVDGMLNEAGFKLDQKRHSQMIEDGPWASVYNYIYFRK